MLDYEIVAIYNNLILLVINGRLHKHKNCFMERYVIMDALKYHICSEDGRFINKRCSPFCQKKSYCLGEDPQFKYSYNFIRGFT